MVGSRGKRWVFGYLVATALIVGAPIAEAKRYRVKITSKPAGAQVLLGSGKTLGKTPLSTRIDGGEHVIILRKQGYVETVETIDVGKRATRFRYNLERAEMGEIRVISKKKAILNGASIYVDGKEVGKTVPATVSVEAGTRQIEVKKDGFENFDEWVEVAPDDTVVVRAFARAKPGSKPTEDDDDDDLESDDLESDNDATEVASASDDGGGGDPVDAKTTKAAEPARPLGSIAVIRLGVDFGGRIFDYITPQTANLRPYTAFAIPIGRAEMELYPLGFSSSWLARAFGITATIGFGAPLKSEADVNGMAEAVDTTWRDWAVGGRFRIPMSPTLALAASGSYGVMSFNFADEETMIAGEVPDVDYSQTMVGLDVETQASKSVSLVFGARFILLSDFGEIGERFTITSSLGLGGFARADVALSDRFDLVVRLAYQRASMDLDMKNPEFSAEGGTDQLLGGMLGLGVKL